MVWHYSDFGILLLALGQCWAWPLTAWPCYSAPASPYRFYSRRTDYKDIRGHGTNFTLTGCTPRKFYLFSRHGIRFPKTDLFEDLQDRIPHLHDRIKESLHNGSLCPHEQMVLRSWKLTMEPNKAEFLSGTGETEGYNLGLRYAQRFPGLLTQPYTPERYKFQHSWTNRTWQTAEEIALGMLNKSGIHMGVNPKPCDPLIKFYKCCEKYVKTIDEKPYAEQKAFEKGPEIHGVIGNVSRRLGLPDGVISFDDIYLMYQSCSYEQDIVGSSPWCLVFSNEDLRILEYWSDLKYYWGYGYGHSIIYEQTCELVKDLLTYLRDSTTTVAGMIRVGHGSTLMPFLARLGVFRDSVSPTAYNMAEQATRKWRSSKIAAFNANLAFVEYQCGSVSKVRVFFNEKPLALPMCPAAGCPLSDILNSYLGKFAESCDLQKTCDMHYNCNGHVTHSGKCVQSVIIG